MKGKSIFLISVLFFILVIGGCNSGVTEPEIPDNAYIYVFHIYGNGQVEITDGSTTCKDRTCTFYIASGHSKTFSLKPLGTTKYIVSIVKQGLGEWSWNNVIKVEDTMSFSVPSWWDGHKTYDIWVVAVDTTSLFMDDEFYNLQDWYLHPYASSNSSVTVSMGYLTPNSFGDGEEWKGPIVYKRLPEDIDFSTENIFASSRLDIQCNQSTDYGLLYFSIRDSSILNQVFNWGWYQYYYGRALFLTVILEADTLYGYTSGNRDYKDITGELWMLKIRDLYLSILFRTQLRDDYLGRYFILDSPLSKKGRYISIGFKTYDSNPTCIMKVDYIRIWKLNGP